MKPIIHQLVHTLSYGDAISSEVLALERCLREFGCVSEIYALNVHPKYKGRAKAVAEFPEDSLGKVILHYSLGSPLNALFRRLHLAERVLIYHNLTPSRWFAGVNPRVVVDIEEGEKELPELCRMTDRLIADSSFNASELKRLGFQSTVLDLPVDPARWSEAANPGMLQLLRSAPGPHIIHVGRLAPNKCIEDIIRTFYFLHHYIDRNARLWLVGIDIDTELYSFGLRRLVHELALSDAVTFTGNMADSEVRALYEAGHVYLCMSEHEGFCLPIVEAFHFGMPVVAFASSAIPDTMGNAGVLVREKKHAEIAEILAEVARPGALRERLVAAGRARVAQLSYETFRKRVGVVLGLEESVGAPSIAVPSAHTDAY